MGFKVSGSDINENANVKMLREMGIKISIGHDESNVEYVHHQNLYNFPYAHNLYL